MKTILITLAILVGFNLNASDVIVTTNDAYPPSNTGSITVDINSLLGNAPFVITVTYVGGSFSHTETVNQYNWTLGNLPPGQYCISIVSENGCAANICVDILKCTNWLGTSQCFSELDYCCYELSPIIVAGEPEGGGGIIGTDVTDFHYIWYTQIDSFYGSSLGADLVDSTYQIVTELLTNGYTTYDTSHQSEIDNPEASFIISFDQENKKINWVWHDFPQESHRLVDRNKEASKNIEVFPNPTQNTFSAHWPEGQYVSVFAVDILGRQAFYYKLDQKKDSGTFSFKTNSPPGVYYLMWKSVEGNVVTKKMVLLQGD